MTFHELQQGRMSAGTWQVPKNIFTMHITLLATGNISYTTVGRNLHQPSPLIAMETLKDRLRPETVQNNLDRTVLSIGVYTQSSVEE